MAKRIAKRVPATPEQAAYIRAAIEDEKQHRDATIAQAREMKEAWLLSKEVLAELRAAREKQGLSLADLRERTGMTREAISRLENNESPNPTLATLVRLASALGMKLHLTVK